MVPDPRADTVAMSCAQWKRQPTTADVLFAFELPYRAPRSAIGTFLWRRRVWLEVTFALSMLQPWEKVLVVTLWYIFLTLLLTAIYLYLPHHLVFVQSRAAYYFLGQEVASASVSDSLQRFAASWGWNTSSSVGTNLGIGWMTGQEL
ncbi:hypothetical protein A0H81_01712 [Grifola frondosa]|uniref:Uncharacterized protein n=1 Tax=Grifola frondosa TaxID=5627 RepID=A0A1C7MMV6_GRIFR|nr:hypothetical protein A0H81_01712 [Grifola frondosa]